MARAEDPSTASAYAFPLAARSGEAPSATGNSHHQQKASRSGGVFRGLLHRRNNSDGTALPPSLSIPTLATLEHGSGSGSGNDDDLDMMMAPGSARTGLLTPRSTKSMVLAPAPGFGAALGELQQHNGQDSSASRSPRRQKDEKRGNSPAKSALSGFGLKSSAAKESGKLVKGRDGSPERPKKTKSSTNLVGLLSRPKSLKNLQKAAAEQEIKDKENRTPSDSMDSSLPPPIYAQFCRDAGNRGEGGSQSSGERFAGQTLHRSADSSSDNLFYNGGEKRYVGAKRLPPTPQDSVKGQPVVRGDDDARKLGSRTNRGSKVLSVFMGHNKTKPDEADEGSSDEPSLIDPKDIDKHLEAMLDRRNIPENQRYKMRNLNSTIKTEFIRQDWAEMQAAKAERPRTTDSDRSDLSVEAAAPTTAPSDKDKEKERDDKPKRGRGKSFTLSRKKEGKEPGSPSKKQKGEATIGRHFRTKSSDSVISDRPSSAGSSASNGILSKIKAQQGPADFVAYLRKVQKPELVEVGKLHKLRLLLRNETVAWTEDFMEKGGMEEIVGLLNRIMAVEWREEHEDALLHENLLCLKALCTTALALQYIHSIQAELFPKLLHLIFDPEKKGPSEFTTRAIITSVLFTYIQSAAPHEREARAKTVLGHLRDPEPKEDERPVGFVLEMRRDRPYRVWCKEAVNVTKEVFWIFLHHLNVVCLPSERHMTGHALTTDSASSAAAAQPDPPCAYMSKHFPQERPPVPAAPYVGGVEWDATNYLASHLDLLNAILACTPSRERRNQLRAELKISGWEKCLGGSLRLCKEKFYGAVHDGLRTWVAAAAEDGWEVRDVRYGPKVESKSPVKKVAAGGGNNANGRGKPKEAAAPPKIDMPRLDFGLDSPAAARQADAWLS